VIRLFALSSVVAVGGVRVLPVTAQRAWMLSGWRACADIGIYVKSGELTLSSRTIMRR
jgi:hypothetical protein